LQPGDSKQRDALRYVPPIHLDEPSTLQIGAAMA